MTTPLLDFDALTAPLAGDHPAGVRLPADVRKKMEDFRKEFEPNPDNPAAPPIPKKPEWPAIIRLASESLSKSSKDLLAAARLVEALTKRDGFAGLHAGLTLLRMLLTDCWDRIHPLIEEPDDLEYRAGPLQWLADTESGAWFPNTIATLPLIRVGGKTVCLADCRKGEFDGQPLSADAIRSAEPADLETESNILECLRELAALDNALAEKMAQQAPALGSLRDVLHDCARFLERPKVEPSQEQENVEGAEGGGGAGGAGTAAPKSGPMTRADLYRQIARLAEELARMEPHSPIPDLLRWTVTLGAMSFRDLIKEMVREEGVLVDIRRRFGIQETPPPG